METPIAIDDTLRALWELVKEKELTPIEAMKEWVRETQQPVSFAINNGVLRYFETAL